MENVENRWNRQNLRLWYTKPAEQWIEALPLGNGRIGAMVYGGVHTERIALSEVTCYSGEPSEENNRKEAPGLIKSMKEALLAGDYKKAKELHEGVYGNKLNYGTNLPVGNLVLDFNKRDADCTGYIRDLKLDAAVASVEYKVNETAYRREIFVSNPHQVMVMKITSSAPEGLYFEASLDGGDNSCETMPDGSGDLLLHGKAYEKLHSDGKSGVDFHCRMRVAAEGGNTDSDGRRIIVEGAYSAVILVALGTTFENRDILPECKSRLDAAAALSYGELSEAHAAEYRHLFNRVELELGDDSHSALPTDVRLNAVKNGKEDAELTALMFQYGRYLLISSSRENSPLPAHLQGVWNDNLACRIVWTCDMHLDINTQMNYWPAEVTNLPECTRPLFKWLKEKLVPSGRLTAKETYGLNGWVAHIFSNAWGFTAPGFGECWALHPTGGAWLATHLWEHYLYTQDAVFLEQQVYPVYRGAVDFFLEYLTPDPESGYLLSGPSISPENFFRCGEGEYAVSMGATCDTVIIRELFNGYLSACEILRCDEETVSRVKEAVSKLPPFKTGKYGQLQEWFYDFEEPDLHHRHTSHLLSVFPFGQISPEKDPDLAEAAKVSILRRTMPEEKWEDTGWAHSLLLLYAARLLDGEWSYKHVLSMQRSLTDNNLMVFSPPVAGAHTNVYEMDGNTGFCAGIAEMLLQSHNEEIHLLPAVPEAWGDGKVKGLRARDGFEVDICWENGKLAEASVYSFVDRLCKIRHKNKKVEINAYSGCRYVLNSELQTIHIFR